MAGKSNLAATLFAQKKLLNKAHTSILKSDAQEVIGSNVQPAAETTFGQKIPTDPVRTLYLLQSASAGFPATVEYVQFNLESLSGTSYDADAVDTGAGGGPSTVGPHAYKLILTGNYQALSSNPKKGNGIYDDSKVVFTTIGGLQLIPPVFSNTSPNPYTIKLYKGDQADATQEIPLEDEIDWQVDTFNGILFVQDYDASTVPLFARGFIYVGEMTDAVIAGAGGAGGGDPNAEYVVLSATGSLNNERVLTAGAGISLNDAGAGNAITISATGGGYFSDPAAGFLNTTGSTSFAGGLGASHVTSNLGSDTFFFVSGAVDSRGTSTRGTSVFGGDVVVSGTLSVNRSDADVSSMVTITTDGKVGIGTDTPAHKLSVGGNMDVGEYIYHKNDADTFIQFADDSIGITAGGEQLITISEDPTFVKIGDGGDVDFQVRTLGDDNTLYVRGDTDRIGIGTNAPSSILHIKESAPTLTFQRENNSNASTIDFVGALGNTGNSIVHDSSTNDLVFKTFNGSGVEEIMRVGDHYGVSKRQIILLSGSGIHAGAMQPKQTSDISFFVSGAIGSKDTTTRGTSVIGGDLVVSGAIVSLGTISGSIDRSRRSYFQSSDTSAHSNITVNQSDFSKANFDMERIDILLNGMLMHSGSSAEVSSASRDYTITGTDSLKFAFDLKIDDIIDVVVYNIK